MGRWRGRLAVGLVLVAATSGLAGARASTVVDPGPSTPAVPAELGAVTYGLPGTRCAGIYEIPLPNGRFLCTHGSDPTVVPDLGRPAAPGHPNGLLLPEPEQAPGPGEVEDPPRIHCYGDGFSGKRVQLVYARASDRPDRWAALVPQLRRWAAEADAVFAASARRLGGTRHLRFLTDPNCVPPVASVVLTPAGDDTFAATTAELVTKGYSNPNRKYLVWVDANALCGVGTVYLDDSPGATNFNNGHPSSTGQVSRIDTRCWGQGPIGHSVEAHEILHTLGGVQRSAPNATSFSHCTDDADLMCYEDSELAELLDVCPSEDEGLLDCNGDDYFNPAPLPLSYLATYWNTARNGFLASTPGLVTVEIGDTGVVEGDAGGSRAVFTLSLNMPAPGPVMVKWATSGSEARAGLDYLAASGTVTFAAGETTRTIAVDLIGETADEPDERFRVLLTSAAGAVISRSPGTATILDDDPRPAGLWIMSDAGQVMPRGSAPKRASLSGLAADEEIAAIAAKPGGTGYWLVNRDGKVYGVGDAQPLGSAPVGNHYLFVTALVASPTGRGYAIVNYDGKVWPFGDAAQLGLDEGVRVTETIWGAARTVSGKGYWLAGDEGTVYPYGDAPDLGSLASPSPSPVYGFAATVSGQGYWLAAGDGTITAFGDAPSLGSPRTGGASVVGIAGTPTGKGYWVVDVTGRVYSFGDAAVFPPPDPYAPPLRILGVAPLR